MAASKIAFWFQPALPPELWKLISDNFEVLTLATSNASPLAVSYLKVLTYDTRQSLDYITKYFTRFSPEGLNKLIASQEIKGDRDILLIAAKQQGMVIQFACEELRDDSEIVKAAVKQDGFAVYWASPRLRSNRKMALTAVKQNGLALKYVAPRLKEDAEIVLAAVKQNGYAIQFACAYMQTDPKVKSVALKQNQHALDTDGQTRSEEMATFAILKGQPESFIQHFHQEEIAYIERQLALLRRRAAYLESIKEKP